MAASPQLAALVREQLANPPTLEQLRRRDVVVRQNMRRHPTAIAARRQRALEREDWTAMANNQRRAQARERIYETGAICDRPRDIEDRS